MVVLWGKDVFLVALLSSMWLKMHTNLIAKRVFRRPWEASVWHGGPYSSRTSHSSLLSIPTSAALWLSSSPRSLQTASVWLPCLCLHIANPSSTCPPLGILSPEHRLVISSLKDPCLLSWTSSGRHAGLASCLSALPMELDWCFAAPLLGLLMSVAYHHSLTSY